MEKGRSNCQGCPAISLQGGADGAGHRGWIVHTVLPCVLLGYVQVRMCVGNKVRKEPGESIQKTLKPIHPLSK